VLLEAHEIPDARERIKQLQAELDTLTAELRQRPPSDADINSETMDVLRSLYYLGIWFRLVADPMDEEQEQEGNAIMTVEPSVLKPYLRHIEAITVHTRKVGSGRASRHFFERGEMVFAEVVVASNMNAHFPLARF
jgi:hypothetical protein